MENVTSSQHRRDAARVRELMTRYAEIELLLRVGEFQKGNDPVADEAVKKHDRIKAFLRQSSDEHFSMDDVRQQLRKLML